MISPFCLAQNNTFFKCGAKINIFKGSRSVYFSELFVNFENHEVEREFHQPFEPIPPFQRV